MFKKFKQWLLETYKFPFDWSPLPEDATTDLKTSFPELQQFFLKYSIPNKIATIAMPTASKVQPNKFELTGKQIKQILNNFNDKRIKNLSYQPNLKPEDYKVAAKEYSRFTPFIKDFYNDDFLNDKNFFVYTYQD
jgi:hypothetical protein